MASKTNTILQGEIWMFDPDPVKGTEIGKKIRLALVISCNSLNKGRSELLIIIPLTTTERGIPSHVRINPPEGGLKKVSFAMCEQIRAISKERLVSRIGTVKSLSILKEIQEWILDLMWIE